MDQAMVDQLIGKTIVKYELSGDSTKLFLTFDTGEIATLETYADCCSWTWIESIDTPEYLLGTIQTIEDLSMPDRGDTPTSKRGEVDWVRYYGLQITTNKGTAVLDYRNDSNGYYSGDIDLKEIT